MLNYIWAALIVSSFVFAISYDVRDLAVNTYRNGEPLAVEIAFTSGYDSASRELPVEVRIEAVEYQRFYQTEEAPSASYAGVVVQTDEGRQLRFDSGASLPEPLATIQGVSRSNEGELQGTLDDFPDPNGRLQGALGTGAAVRTALIFEPVRFVKMNEISAAALNFAGTAAEIALGLIGILALFLGLLKIAEEAGIINSLVRVVRPILRPLFPAVPDDHPALGMIALNLTANIFGLGNAATPFGIKAMEELQTLNPSEDTATDSMVMLLAINTASIQLVPPVLLLALLGLQINQLIFAIIITTGLSLIIAIAAVKLYSRLPSVRKSNPHRHRSADSIGEAALPRPKA
jgi:spore maturation protein A